jgi:CRISPR-associated protein Cmr1
VLNAFGKKMLLYRSWGKGGKLLNEDSEKRFKADHDWSKGDRPNNFHPKRVVFGLPHNYGQGDHLAVTPEKHRDPYPEGVYKHDRRASPLFFHVHKIGTEYIGVSLLLPATFLPHGERINAGGTNVPANIEWSILTDFLDGRDNKGKVRFDSKQSIISGVAIR